MNAICLVLDRLNQGFLGPYGNTWVETPHFDRLASQAFVFDQALTDTPQLQRLYRTYWHGWHAMRGDDPPGDRPGLLALLGERGVKTVLWTDSAEMVHLSLSAGFTEQIHDEAPPASGPAGSIEQTHLARSFAGLTETLASLGEPFLVWCHLASLGTTWDAPWEFRSRYQEEGDPEPLESAEVPCQMLRPGHDPDEPLRAAQAYAGQVTLLDVCLGGLLEFLEQSPLGSRTLLSVTSARGLPLGEHLRVGACDDAIYGPLVQVPLVLRLPDGSGAAARSQTLVEPADLWATLLDVFEVRARAPSPTGRSLLATVRADAPLGRDRLGVVAGRQRAIRTPAWYMRVDEERELFAKPDDRWEVNNIARRFPEIADAVEATLTEFAQALQSDSPQFAPLDDVLRDGIG